MKQAAGSRRARWSALVPALALSVAGLSWSGAATGAPVPFKVTPAPNPPIEDSCGVDVTLVLDASGSIESSNAVGSVRAAAATFLDALNNTASTARVTQFATVSEELAPRTLVDDASLGQGGPLQQAVSGYYNPKPPRPGSVNFWQYRSGNPQSASSFRQENNLNQYTNWDQSLDQAGQEVPELVVYVTDGDPTAYDFNQPGDPFDPGPPPDVAVQTDRDQARQVTLDRAVVEANDIKANTRMLAVGVGSALSNSASQARLEAIAGPQVVKDADLATIDSLNDVDVALVTRFEDLARFLRRVVLELCSPSLTIRKLAQTAGDANYQPGQGWDITVTPTVPGATFTWVLPDTAPAPSKTVGTNADGFAQFQWEPDPADADSRALVEEALEPGYIAGRPPDPDLPPEESVDYRCEAKNERGDVRVIAGELDTTGANPAFTLDPIAQEVVTCTLWNSYDYQPAIALAKVNAPTEVRGDLTPPAPVTSTYQVTNPGNTPLDNIVLTDDRCAPVQPALQGGNNVGDANGDGRLDPGERWEYTCTRGISTSPPADPGGTNIVNVATVSGTDPEGTKVDAQATDDVDAFSPAIALTKLVNGQASVVVPAGSDVTYTFAVTNDGNTPLSPVVLADVSSPDTGCASPTFTGGDADNDQALDLTETWTYECVATIDQNTTNTATVTGTPLNPVTGGPFPDPNPPVTDTDRAEVTTIDPALTLTKDVDKAVVFPGTSVAYTYSATNEGDTDLRNDTGNPGWLTDDKCSLVEGVPSNADNVGDLNGDDLLNPGETWKFTCSNDILVDTFNTATIVAQPVVGGQPQGVPLERTDTALVEVVEPGIALNKTALKPVVLDPDTVYLGPNLPDPARYEYEVTNIGDVPLRNVDLGDDTCAPVDFVDGDTNGDGNLDVDEVWIYRCLTPLQRQQGTPPPIGAESGLVTNRATVTATPFLPGDPTQETPNVSDTDIAQVLVIEPSISIEKTVEPPVVLVGGDVTYTFVVRNTGDVGLRQVGPTDDKCAPLVYVSGDTNNNDILDGANSAAAESWTYTCSRSIGLPEAPATSDINKVSVRGIDPLGNAYIDSDKAEVRVVDPAINLEKSVSDSLVPSGTEVTYEFVVTNVGTSPVPANDLLAQVTLADAAEPAQPTCASPTLVAKEGGNGDDFLDRDPAETWRYECRSTITEPTTNVAVVGGLGGTQFGLEVPVVDVAAAFVRPFTPAIEVVKTAEPTVLLGSGEVTYTYEVRNTGDVPLAGVAERITDDTCSPVTYVSGDEDGDGLLDTPTSIFEDTLDETWTFTCTTTVDETTTNVVEVPGTPTDPGGEPLCGPEEPSTASRVSQPCDVTGTDTETVTVLDPARITIVKQAEPEGPTAFPFTGDLGEFSLTDPGSGETNRRSFEDLAPGAYEVAEAVPDGWERAGISCEGGTVEIAQSAVVVTIALEEGDDVTCIFANRQLPPPTTATPTTAPPATGPPPVTSPPPPSSGGLAMTGLGGPGLLLAGFAALGAGLGLVALAGSRRRRWRW